MVVDCNKDVVGLISRTSLKHTGHLDDEGCQDADEESNLLEWAIKGAVVHARKHT